MLRAMKTLGIFLSLSVAIAAHAQLLQAHVATADRTIDRLMMAKDVKGLKKTLQAGVTSDFKYVEGGQTQSFEAMSANMTMGILSMKSLRKVEAKAISVKEKGSTGTVMTMHLMEGTTIGADKKPHTLTFSGTSEDTYVKQGGKWKLSRMAWVKQSMTMDGKPFTGR